MPGRDYDFWLFDLDGTLVDVESWYPRHIFDQVGARLDERFTDREADVLWYGLGEGRGNLLERRDIDRDEFWDAFHEVENPQSRADATYLYDDAEVVADIEAPTGLVTHCQFYLTDPLLDRLDIRDWFDAVVCCTDETGWKPDPTPVELAMADLGVGYNGQEGVLAGDDQADMGAAWNAGLDAAHVSRVDPQERGHCVRGDHRVESLGDLLGAPGRRHESDVTAGSGR